MLPTAVESIRRARVFGIGGHVSTQTDTTLTFAFDPSYYTLGMPLPIPAPAFIVCFLRCTARPQHSLILLCHIFMEGITIRTSNFFFYTHGFGECVRFPWISVSG